METLYMLGGIAGAVMAVVGLGSWIAKAIKSATSPLKAIDAELRAIEARIDKANHATAASLKYSISRAHREYMRDGKIDRYALQCVEEMHDRYKELGGNGFVDRLIADLCALPVAAPMPWSGE